MVNFSMKYGRYSEFMLHLQLISNFQTQYTAYESFLVQILLHLPTNENNTMHWLLPDDMLHYIDKISSRWGLSQRAPA